MLEKTYGRQIGLTAGIGALTGGAIGGKKGALIGAGAGAILGTITAALTRSFFNKKPQSNITTKNLYDEFSKSVNYFSKGSLEINTEKYDLNNSNPALFDINVKSNEDSMILYIRPINIEETNAVDRILDYWCENSKYNDYTAERAEDGGWIVTAKLVNYKSAASLLFELMSELEFRINFIL